MATTKYFYCSSCGVAVTPGLSYCNHCGSRLNRDESVVRSPQVRPETLVFGMIAAFVFGLVGTAMLLGVLKVILQLRSAQVLPFAILCFLIMIVLEGVFIRLLLRSQQQSSTDRAITFPRESVTNELEPAPARVLPEPVPSVTEHTTRAFDPIYTERKK